MSRIPVMIDVDTGVDDALAIVTALKLDRLDVRGFTTVRGNAPLSMTTWNTLRVLEIAGSKLPVYPGADKAILAEPVKPSAHVHGHDGLGDIGLPAPKRQPEEKKAWDAIYEEAVRQQGELVLIAVGPLTNLAMAVMKYRDLPQLIKKIVIMGGASSYGNVTPAAEFNIYADPEAAEMVFSSGIPVHMCGLDITMKLWFTPEELDALGRLNVVGKVIRDAMQIVQGFSLDLGLEGVCMHDPCAVLYAAEPERFKAEECGIRVETCGKCTRGKTVTDFGVDRRFDFKNGFVVYDADREAFRDRIMELVSAYGA